MNGLNLVARKVIMSAALYYGADSPAVDDATYDRMTHIIEGMWDEVDPYLQWQLGGLEGLTTSGFDYKVTAATIGGAVSWYKSVYPDHELFIPDEQDWQVSEDYPGFDRIERGPLRWVPAGRVRLITGD
jgi:hypothetical protein